MIVRYSVNLMTRDDELWLAMGNLIGNGTIGDGQHDGQ